MRKLLTITALIVAALAAVAPDGAEANRDELLALALDVAKVSVNEHRTEDDRGLWEGPSAEETLLIVQTTESHGRRLETRQRWLRRHSCRVLDHPTDDCPKVCREGHPCQWSRNLTWSDAKPEGWPDPYPWRPEVWERVRVLAFMALAGRVTARPCLGRPQTWGSRRRDYEGALARGMVPLSCDTPDDGNVGFRWAPAEIPTGPAIPAALAVP